MRIGIVGCGFTADYYVQCIRMYPDLELVAATDKDQQRASEFCKYNSVEPRSNLDALLSDPSIEMILNLTSSTSHYKVSKACLEAGKHLFTEKPLATSFEEARELVELAEAKGLGFASAPSYLLSETAQTLWRALSNNTIGPVHLVLADLADGPFHLAEPHTWRSPSGATYDYREEFNVGVSIEHASYYLGSFVAFFGPAKSITSFSTCLWPEKPISPDETLHITSPDFSVSCITFESGVVARLTCSLVSPFNHIMKIVGDTGVLSINDCWNFNSPVYHDRYSQLQFKADRYPITKEFPTIRNWTDLHKRKHPPVRKVNLYKQYTRYRMDYARGVAELARSINEKRRCRLPSDYCQHVNELLLAIHKGDGTPYQVTTSFKPLQPLDDAELKALIPAEW
ncbi:MAG: Gfo/Idh/MocA family oxidoreductase [Terracidiphilus sp.]